MTDGISSWQEELRDIAGMDREPPRAQPPRASRYHQALFVLGGLQLELTGPFTLADLQILRRILDLLEGDLKCQSLGK